MLSVTNEHIMLSVILLSVIMLNVIMLNAVTPNKLLKTIKTMGPYNHVTIRISRWKSFKNQNKLSEILFGSTYE